MAAASASQSGPATSPTRATRWPPARWRPAPPLHCGPAGGHRRPSRSVPAGRVPFAPATPPPAPTRGGRPPTGRSRRRPRPPPAPRRGLTAPGPRRTNRHPVARLPHQRPRRLPPEPLVRAPRAGVGGIGNDGHLAVGLDARDEEVGDGHDRGGGVGNGEGGGGQRVWRRHARRRAVGHDRLVAVGRPHDTGPRAGDEGVWSGGRPPGRPPSGGWPGLWSRMRVATTRWTVEKTSTAVVRHSSTASASPKEASTRPPGCAISTIASGQPAATPRPDLSNTSRANAAESYARNRDWPLGLVTQSGQ